MELKDAADAHSDKPEQFVHISEQCGDEVIVHDFPLNRKSSKLEIRFVDKKQEEGSAHSWSDGYKDGTLTLVIAAQADTRWYFSADREIKSFIEFDQEIVDRSRALSANQFFVRDMQMIRQW